MRTVLLISANVTGQTPGYSRMSKDIIEFPANFREDAFAEYCLDAPLYIPTGCTLSVLRGDTYNLWGQADTETRDGTYWSLS